MTARDSKQINYGSKQYKKISIKSFIKSKVLIVDLNNFAYSHFRLILVYEQLVGLYGHCNSASKIKGIDQNRNSFLNLPITTLQLLQII